MNTVPVGFVLYSWIDDSIDVFNATFLFNVEVANKTTNKFPLIVLREMSTDSIDANSLSDQHVIDNLNEFEPYAKLVITLFTISSALSFVLFIFALLCTYNCVWLRKCITRHEDIEHGVGANRDEENESAEVKPLNSFCSSDKIKTSTKLYLPESLYFFILLVSNIILLAGCILSFATNHYNKTLYYNITHVDIRVEATIFGMYMYSLLCTIVSCFIFSKLAYSVTRRCLDLYNKLQIFPGNGTQPPANGTQPPANGTQPPTDGTQPPADGTQPPGNGTQPPGNGTQPPGNGTQPPADGTQLPADGTQPPADGTQPPADGTQPPADGTQPPANGTQAPGNGTQPPADGTQPPADGTQPPANGTQPPADGTQPPADGTQPPANGTQPPGNGTQPPADGTQPPANDPDGNPAEGCLGDGILKYLIDEDDKFTEMAQATLNMFEYWFTVHWVCYTVTSFLSVALFFDMLTKHIQSQFNKPPDTAIGFSQVELIVIGLFTLQHCFLFLYPCFKAAAVTVGREKLIKKVNAYQDPKLNHQNKQFLIQYLKNKKFGFRISFFCARLRFGFNVAYISIFIGLLGVLLKLTGVF